MKILVTGSTGRLGSMLTSLDWATHEVLGITREHANLSDEAETRQTIGDLAPDAVVHTAASTDLTRCEQDRQYAWENVALPALHVAQACIASGSRMIHISTDYVFSGDEPQHPIPTWMRPDPTHYYAICKVAAEIAARAVPNHCIVRGTMKPREPWRHTQAPRDMWISHSYYDEIAGFIRDATLSGTEGIVHFGVRDVNVYEFAKSTRPDVIPVTRADISTLDLPGDIRLEVSRDS